MVNYYPCNNNTEQHLTPVWWWNWNPLKPCVAWLGSCVKWPVKRSHPHPPLASNTAPVSHRNLFQPQSHSDFLFLQDEEEQTKSPEDLEFQKLEREVNQGEEKENQSQELLQEIAEYQRLTLTRKVRYQVAPPAGEWRVLGLHDR